MFLSIMGMYEYDPSIFDGLDLPTYTDPDTQTVYTLDKDKLVQNILLQCSDLEVIYPDIQTMKLAIGVWSAAEFRTWEKLFATTMIKYNPIWNVDADITDTITGSENRDIARTGSGSANRTLNLADNETVNLTDTESVKGFNSNTWAESHKVDKTGTDNIAHTGTDNTILTNGETVDDDVTRSETRTQRRTGNIGVTMTQQLLEAERNIAEFSMLNYIMMSFKKRFCLLVY